MLPDTMADVDPIKPPIIRQLTSYFSYNLSPLKQKSVSPIFFRYSFLVLISHSSPRSCFPELDGKNAHELAQTIDNKISINFIVNSDKRSAQLTTKMFDVGFNAFLYIRVTGNIFPFKPLIM
jgi:hypothetical protein